MRTILCVLVFLAMASPRCRAFPIPERPLPPRIFIVGWNGTVPDAPEWRVRDHRA